MAKVKEWLVVCGTRGDVEDNWERRVLASSKAEVLREIAKSGGGCVVRDMWVLDDDPEKKGLKKTAGKKGFRPPTPYAVVLYIGGPDGVSMFHEFTGTKEEADEFLKDRPLGQDRASERVHRRVLYRMKPVPGQPRFRRRG